MRLAGRTVCVSDIAVSADFYGSVFGFRTVSARHGLEGEWLDRAVGHPGVRLDWYRLVNPQGIALHLQGFERPAPVGSRTRRPMNAFGLTHLNFYVRDLTQTLEELRAHGGQVHEHTWLDTRLEDGSECSMVYCSDPDGVRVELWTTRPYGRGNSMATPYPGLDRKFSHSGICVADPQRSLDFYSRLGFESAEEFDYRPFPGALDRMCELEDSRLYARMMRSADGQVLELLFWEHPPPFGPRTRPPAHKYGFSQLVFEVDDLEGTADVLARAGGRVFPESHCTADGYDRLQCADPDGVRIELIRERTP